MLLPKGLLNDFLEKDKKKMKGCPKSKWRPFLSNKLELEKCVVALDGIAVTHPCNFTVLAELGA